MRLNDEVNDASKFSTPFIHIPWVDGLHGKTPPNFLYRPFEICPSGIPTMVPKMAEEVKPSKFQVSRILPDETDIYLDAGNPRSLANSLILIPLPVTNKLLMSTL